MSILAVRSCELCGDVYLPRSTVQRYCSARCREVVKYRARKADPIRWAAALEQKRRKYTPRPREMAQRQCSASGCEAKHFALGLCRSHYRRKRWAEGRDGREAASSRAPIGALAKHYDATGTFVEEPFPVAVYADLSPTLVFPRCPECSAMLRKLSADSDPLDIRDCVPCRLRVNLNAEEVAWVISERRSTAL